METHGTYAILECLPGGVTFALSLQLILMKLHVFASQYDKLNSCLVAFYLYKNMNSIIILLLILHDSVKVVHFTVEIK